jgi:VanZ family protein
MGLKLRPLWLALGWVMVGAVIYLSLMSDPPQPLQVSHADKIEHALAYAGLGLWFFQLLPAASHVRAGVLLCLLGVHIEIAQAYTPTRSFEFADMAADATGVLLGWYLARTRMGRLVAGMERMLLKKAV